MKRQQRRGDLSCLFVTAKANFNDCFSNITITKIKASRHPLQDMRTGILDFIIRLPFQHNSNIMAMDFHFFSISVEILSHKYTLIQKRSLNFTRAPQLYFILTLTYPQNIFLMYSFNILANVYGISNQKWHYFQFFFPTCSCRLPQKKGVLCLVFTEMFLQYYQWMFVTHGASGSRRVKNVASIKEDNFTQCYPEMGALC